MASSSAQTTSQARVNVTISKDSMSASILLRKPPDGDKDITVEEVLEMLHDQGVVFGIDQHVIEETVNNNVYNTPVRAAQGVMPKRGDSSTFEYHFDTSSEHKPTEDSDGRIDYKNINFIQNIEKDGLLVTRHPAKPGQPGTNIYGKTIKGIDGRNLPIKFGANTKVSEDGNMLTATCSGAIIFLYNKVAVNDVMVINGDVDFNVGNIDCRGSVRISGGIKTGFSIKTDGDLEVNGNVEDAVIEVQGNVMIKGGFFGKGEGKMVAGGDVFVKFIEGQKIFAGGDIIVGGEVIKCQLESSGNIIVKGTDGKIVGGEARAKKEIRASYLGSDTGTRTCLAVAYEPELMKRYQKCVNEIDRLKNDTPRIKEALAGLYRLQMDNKLSKPQEEALKKLEKFKNDLPINFKHLDEEKQEIESELQKLDGARIVAEKKLFSGVKAVFGLIYREILEDSECCVMKMDNNKIFLSEYSKGD